MGNRLNSLCRVIIGISRRKWRSRQAVLWAMEAKWALLAVADAKTLADRAALVPVGPVALDELAVVVAKVEVRRNRLVITDIRGLAAAVARQVGRERARNDRRVERQCRRAAVVV